MAPRSLSPFDIDVFAPSVVFDVENTGSDGCVLFLKKAPSIEVAFAIPLAYVNDVKMLNLAPAFVLDCDFAGNDASVERVSLAFAAPTLFDAVIKPFTVPARTFAPAYAFPFTDPLTSRPAPDAARARALVFEIAFAAIGTPTVAW